ncbi:MAG: OmpA family protein [Acidobacteriota bacterium]
MKHRTPNRTLRAGLGLGTLTLLCIGATGCASKGFVTKSLAEEREQMSQQIAELSTQIETSQSDIAQHSGHLDRHDGEIEGLETKTEEISGTAREALDRALQAGKLAEGQFVSETVLATDQLTFGFESADLDEAAAEVLGEFASQLYDDNNNVFIEIQGHTDSTGPEAYNLILGQQRAEAVRDHLYKEHNVPLHRMAIFSYGEEAELVPNDTREGRAQNRRVSLIVLR